MNWFLYIVNTTCEAEEIYGGESGLGKTTLGPGIADMPYGTMYVVPEQYMRDYFYNRYMVTGKIKEAILEYYAV